MVLSTCITLLESDLPVGVCFALGVADGWFPDRHL